ncbi:MAG: hypothetical protein AABZ08_08375 [Planctomycetota bacterium]
MRILLTVFLFASLSGCAESTRGPVVFFLDGAGWYASGGAVENGLRKAGYKGEYEVFTWSAFLGPAQDHFITAQSKIVARRLAGKIERVRKNDPDGAIQVMGLSAGTAVILSALEELPDGVQVDNVVLLSPSASAERDLTKIMQHVRRNLYATCSPHDGIVAALAVNADGRPGPPAGEKGLRMPRKGDAQTQAAYARVINIPWQPSYVGFNWNGSHTGVTSDDFIAGVIAPRILSAEPFPLDRPVLERFAVGSER